MRSFNGPFADSSFENAPIGLVNNWDEYLYKNADRNSTQLSNTKPASDKLQQTNNKVLTEYLEATSSYNQVHVNNFLQYLNMLEY